MHPLTAQQIASYERDGVLFPIRVMDEDEAAAALQRLKEFEEHEGGCLSGTTNLKPHIFMPWLSDIVRHPKILDAVETILGHNILCWGSNFFVKAPADGKYISWHQDSTYWGLSSARVVSAWVALTPSTPMSGCLRVIPGTHTECQMPHRDTFAQDNLLSRGQEIAVEVDCSKAIDVVLQPGEMSLHHVRIFHGSEPNRSNDWRIGFAIRYIPTYVRQLGARTTALLVRGKDEFRNFDPEPIPNFEFEPSAVAFHAESLKRMRPVVYAGTDKASDPPLVE